MTKHPVILLVDDEPSVTDSLKRALRREPYQFLTATSAREALLAFEQHSIDVIISDERMPGMTGSELLAAVRKRSAHTIRMILSGHASLDAAVRAINEGEVYRFFLKPIAPAELVIAIQQALLHKRLQDQSRSLLRKYQKQTAMLALLERSSPGILRIDVDDQGAVVVDESDAELTIEDLLDEMQRAMHSDAA